LSRLGIVRLEHEVERHDLALYDAHCVVLHVPIHSGGCGNIVRRGNHAGDRVAAHMCALYGRREACRDGFCKSLEQQFLADNSERVLPIRFEQRDVIVEERTRSVDVAPVQGVRECAEHGLGILSFCGGTLRVHPKADTHDNRREQSEGGD
jgi:hypothetical protein